MRRSLAVLFGLLVASSAQAAVPTTFSVQGVLRNASGQLQSMMVNVTITLYDTQTAGMGNKLAGPFGPSAVMASNGLFTLTLTDANLVSELASAPDVWLEMIVGNDTFPRQHVTPELFSLLSSQADNAFKLGGVAASSYVTSSSLNTTLGSYVTSSSLNTTLGSYVTSSSLTSTLGSYETTSAATAAFQPKGSYQAPLSTASCPSGQAYASIAANGTATCINSVSSADSLSNKCSGCVVNSNIAGGAVTASNIASGALTHNHSVSVSQTNSASSQINFGAATGTPQTQCSPGCPSGTTPVGGSCTISGGGSNQCGTGTTGAQGAITGSFPSGSQWCCTGFTGYSGAACELNATALCLSLSTGNAL